MEIISPFTARANTIKLWKIRSQEFYQAAEIVWKSEITDFQGGISEDSLRFHHLYRPALLLMGFSLETLLKACIIQKENGTKLDAKYIRGLKTHELGKLYSRLGYPVNNEDKIKLDRWSDAIYWVSKYPVPLKESDFDIDKLVRHDSDWTDFSKIYTQLLSNLNSDNTGDYPLA